MLTGRVYRTFAAYPLLDTGGRIDHQPSFITAHPSSQHSPRNKTLRKTVYPDYCPKICGFCAVTCYAKPNRQSNLRCNLEGLFSPCASRRPTSADPRRISPWPWPRRRRQSNLRKQIKQTGRTRISRSTRALHGAAHVACCAEEAAPALTADVGEICGGRQDGFRHGAGGRRGEAL